MFYNESSVHSIHATKKCAEKCARIGGFKLNKKDNLFENNKEMTYRKIEFGEFICSCIPKPWNRRAEAKDETTNTPK
jgi:hypothetical protein